MSNIELPAGTYISLSGMITNSNGGQMRALLMRNRLFAQRAGIEPVLVTFDTTPTYPRVREVLREQGQLVEPMRLLNIYEWYRERDLDDLQTLGDDLPDVGELNGVDEKHPDGTIHRTRYFNPRTRDEAMTDFRRPDGSVYVRVPSGRAEEKNYLSPVFLVNRSGRPVARWPNFSGWHQYWIRELVPSGERAFIISDSRFQLPNILDMSDDQFHILHLMHNIHTGGAHRWNSLIKATYLPTLQRIRQLDGLVTLTNRQREDIADRFGETNNLFVVANPVELPPRPDPLPQRNTNRFAIVTRLEGQKRLEHAIRAFALVLKEEPEATLDIYGAGSRHSALEEEIAVQGVGNSVRLRGHDPTARDKLWTATGFLMTSGFEGYPLATLESMSRGCPVISYDIKYGPREQISDGIDGFLVEPDDIQGVADRVVELIRHPELVKKMSEAALNRAAQHDYAAFIDDWRIVLESAVAAKQRRTTLESVTLRVSLLGHFHRFNLPSAFGRFAGIGRFARSRASSAAWKNSRRFEFEAKLKVVGHSPQASLESAVVTLHAVGPNAGSIVPIPIDVQLSDTTFRLSASFDIADVFQGAAAIERSIQLRLRLVWENSSWETTLRRPRRFQPNFEVSFAGTGEISLNRAIPTVHSDTPRSAGP